ncbi:MAG: hypothetical protein ACPG49_05080 [Chitinophagales bacterium]
MKALLSTLIGILAIIFTFILLGFVTFMSQPNPPIETLKISGEKWELKSEFHELNPDFWEKKGGKLIFNNQTTEKQRATLHTNALPSEQKKKGYITTSVKVSANDLIEKEAIVGIQIGERTAKGKNQLVMGINGEGEIVVLDGNLKPLMREKVKVGKKLEGNMEEMELSFHYYANPKGWIVFFQAKNENGRSGATINHIPFEKLDSENKEVSLVAYNPSQKGEVSFEDWKLQNDWTPND